MKKQKNYRLKLLVRLIISSILVTGAEVALAQDTVDLGTVQGSGTNAADATGDPASAPYQAPTQGSLTATEPVSIINRHYIEENAGAAANYPDIAQISPSMWSVDPNGPGGMESQSGGPFLRGFQNGQYNVTFDGIPWGDSNDFTQHSTSYFMPQDTGGIAVDRGPGDASNIGNATFGGTIAVTSKDPLTTPTFTPYASVGSFNSHLEGVEYDTGIMHNYGDASAFIDYKKYSTDGYLTNASQQRSNLFVKFNKPISDNTMLTLVAMQNNLHQNVASGTTLANLQKYGNNYGLNEDPTSQNFAGYNYDHIRSDFEYIGLQSQQGSWHIDNKLYTYAYNHNGFNGADQGGAMPNGTVNANGTLNPNDVPGNRMSMDYRSIGDILRLSDAIGPGYLNLGTWIDRQTNSRSQFEIDWTNGGGFNYINSNPVTGAPSPIDRLMNDSLTSVQPYIDYAWQVTNALVITPGLKYSSFTRSVDASNIQGTGLPYNGSATWSAVLPALTAHYAIQKDWSAYLQIAKGFQAPNLSTFYQSNVDLNTVNPETTMNYQLGTTWSSKRVTLSADLYKIDFNNKQVATPIQNATIYTNVGGATYQGFETEDTYYVGQGYSLYGNYSFNSAKVNSNNQWLPDAPEHTAAAGVIYNQGPVYASLLTKFVSSRYGDVGQTIPLGAYAVTNFATSYTIKHFADWAKDANIGFQINNLLNNQSIYALGTYDANNNAMYYTLPERSFQLTFSVSM